MMVPVAAVSVVIPTLGRPAQLEACLSSLERCRPRPEEILIVDESAGVETSRVIDSAGARMARRIAAPGRGLAAAFNLGLVQAAHDSILITNDDCTVRSDWVGAGQRLLRGSPDALITGPVLPLGDRRAVPSFITDTTRREYVGAPRCDKLYTNNMAVMRATALACGGFDERFRAVAEDNDLCYRWLRGGRRILYEPEMVVWHHDWRTPEQMREQFRRYAYWQGAFYAKHLRRGDLRVLRFVGRDLRSAIGGLVAAPGRRASEWPDPRRALLRDMPAGMLAGWRLFRQQDQAPGDS